MAGIYIHIPFCKQACSYCNFHFSTSLRLREPLVQALLRELHVRRGELASQPITTVYFGGGTPSLLPAADLARIFDQLRADYDLAPTAEITLEANPDDLTAEKLRILRDSPVNRLSIGIQSFHSPDLLLMNRAHTALEAEACLALALEYGFADLSVDLIYGVPSTTDAVWHNNIRRVLQYPIPHLSAYALTVEPRTALAHRVKRGQVLLPDDAQVVRQFDYLMHEMGAHGYEHYEISNFARPGRYSRHNTSYWQNQPYVGIGPAAHSFDGQSVRSWNIANNAAYIRGLQAVHTPADWAAQAGTLYEREQLGPADTYNEYVMTRLRTQWGCDAATLAARWSPPFVQHFTQAIRPFIEKKWVSNAPPNYVLTAAGKHYADYIASELFWTGTVEEMTPTVPEE